MPPRSTPRNYASIMVSIGLSSSAENRAALAAVLASRFGSHLIGIAAEEAMLPYYEDGLGAARPILIENERQTAAEDLAQAETNFRRGVAGLHGIEWRSGIQRPSEYVASQARAADLLIVARPSSDDYHRMTFLDPRDVVMELGRPVLVVPHDCRNIRGRSIVVAWKETREARRAILDALPFLQRAEIVTVLAVGEGAREQGVEDVCAHLMRHNVASRHVIRSSLPGSDADAIIDAALEEGSDLIVSGAYGHSRVREWIFGGVTAALLANSPVPCLMSH